MKREVMFVLILALFLVTILFINASEESQVEDAYTCLETRINQTGCSTLNFDEKVFSYLAAGECGSELSSENLSNQCWPKSGCKIKSTAQAILALNKKANTTKAENWLLTQTAIPTNIDWFLEIESSSGATSCKVSYSGATYTITINEDKKISSNAGSSLILAQDGYWLKISPNIYNRDINIECDKAFITTLLFKKLGSSTVHVSDEVYGAGAGGTTIERVNSLCFAQGGVCNYEGSLWAALVLSSQGHDVSNFMPYLITLKDDLANQIYIPESFLYYLTGKFRAELLLKQRASSYWEESGNRYYDTALALLPFGYESPNEKAGSKSWLLSVQLRSGCWNNGNIKDTAFLLYSIWPKTPSLPPGRCDNDYDCPQVDCKTAWCSNGECKYEYDGSCQEQECETNSDCPSTEYSGNYCLDDETVYQDTYTYTCDTVQGLCATEIDENLVEACSNSEICEDGTCVQESCSWYNPCDTGYDCISNVCVPQGGECENNADCEIYDYTSNNFCSDSLTVSKTSYTYYCNDESMCVANADKDIVVKTCSSLEKCDGGECISEGGNECSWLFNPCDSGYKCVDGICIPEGECEYDVDCIEESCMEASCSSGTCKYEYTACADNDYCCNPGCDYSNDNDCGEAPQCTSDADCSDYNYDTGEYCWGDDYNEVYTDFYNYTCENNFCSENLIEKLVKECSSSEECYAGVCYNTGGTSECESELDCLDGESCVGGSCIADEGCIDSYDCDYYEQCVDGFCSPYECESELDCLDGGICSSEGYCVYETSSCQTEGYFCTSKANCDNSGGNILQDYSCTGDLYQCCDTEPVLMTCSYWGGNICASDEFCQSGTVTDVSDTFPGEQCCIDGTCVEGGTSEYYCEDQGGTCRDSFCNDGEEEKSYICSYSDEICCVTSDVSEKPKRGWILIVILLLLIILSVVGIVFRDKVRTQWIKIKDKFSGKKEKKKFEMPMTAHPNPQGRILPRRILPPGQNNPNPQQRFQMRRPMGPPGSRPVPGQPIPSGKSGAPQQGKPTQQPTNPSPSPNQPVQNTPKKPEEKPKNGDLDDVLKKLKEMGNK